MCASCTRRAWLRRSTTRASSPSTPRARPDGELYLATRYVEGTDLRGCSRMARCLSQRALAIVGQIAEALDAAHARGLVHRDVKPANILVDAADHGYLCDFGLTKQEARPRRSPGWWSGRSTIWLPSRSVANGGRACADQYALAAVLYECLAGAASVPARDRGADALGAHAGAATRASVARQDLPPALDGVIGRGLAKTPEERFAYVRGIPRRGAGCRRPRRRRPSCAAVAGSGAGWRSAGASCSPSRWPPRRSPSRSARTTR